MRGLAKRRASLVCCFVMLHLTIGLARPCWEEVTPALGLEPGTTSVIRKPIIALLLAKYGLEPDVTSETWSHVGLLVKRDTTSRNHPALHFVEGNEPEFNDDRHRRYYDIVPNRELPYMYPLASPSRRVDIHTSYTP